MGFQTDRKPNVSLQARINELRKSKHVVKVGVQGDQASALHEGMDKGAPLTNVKLAQIHEFGAPAAGIPERSFLRSTARNQAAQIKWEQAAILNKYLKGEITIERGLAVLGASIVNKIKRTIREGISPELKPKTIARKGSSTPLIDTGQLINSITYDVVEE